MTAGEDPLIELSFEAEVIYWRGPSPFFYAPLDPQGAEAVRKVMRAVTYGWGMVPVEASIGGVGFKTALFPKDDTYLLPLKAEVRRKADITAGDVVAIDLTIQPPGGGGKGRWPI